MEILIFVHGGQFNASRYASCYIVHSRCWPTCSLNYIYTSIAASCACPPSASQR